MTLTTMNETVPQIRLRPLWRLSLIIGLVMTLLACSGGDTADIKAAAERYITANSNMLATYNRSVEVLECKQTGDDTGVCNVEFRPHAGGEYREEWMVKQTAFNGWRVR
ncbi:hypothetical protein V6617_01300 [Pelagibacterium nitratireducens]|uniref:Lipoprotein n=1 Tax=Pelagibacterium nitratireducens TaxID=1046114 RepID=A0ABZ2I5D8_9HYPH